MLKTRNYRTYYVMAFSYEEAKVKVENRIIEKDSDSILREDGSLKKDYNLDEVEAITYLGNKFIK